MWIVRLALERRLTFIVMAIVILFATPLSLMKTPVDVLPDINIPVVSVIWSYNGMSAQEVSNRITSVHERSLTTTVNDIEHIESQTLPGIGIIKIYFQPNVNVDLAISQIVAISQAIIRLMPPGTLPPLVIKYTASSVPVIQIGMSSTTLSDQELFDTATNIIRPPLVTIPGVAIPWPYGGKPRVVSVDLDSNALLAKGLSASDVINAVSTQNLTLPSGTAKMGDIEYNVSLNGSPNSIEGLNAIPVTTVNGATVYLRDVAHVRDGFSPQTNLVRQNGTRGVLLSVLKNGGSTLQVVAGIKALLPSVMATAPPGIDVNYLFDQSVFVQASIDSVIHEAVVAALLTALMLLLFLGNWRITTIIAVSIPLSIFTSVIGLHAVGESINIMTLGGLALAVGILVDDATVTIENIERHLHMGTDLYNAILDGAGEIAVPAFVSTLCICIVFIPMFFLGGVARYLFVPMAEAVIFAMLASYVLSRTLVPTLALMMMGHPGNKTSRFVAWLHEVNRKFNERFEHVRGQYVLLLSFLLTHRRKFVSYFLTFCAVSCVLFLFLGRDLFPVIDSGELKLHVRAPTGTRIESTAVIVDQVENVIREVIPPQDLGTILDNIGVPYSGINLSYSTSGIIGTIDADVMVSLNKGHSATADYIDDLMPKLREKFPGVEFYIQPADVVTQILNFGIPAAINVQITGRNSDANNQFAGKLVEKIARIPGAADVHIQERLDNPELKLSMNRSKLQSSGLTPNDVAQNLLLPLSGNAQTSPAFWLNPGNDIVYNLTLQTPQYKISSVNDVLNLPVGPASGSGTLSRNKSVPSVMGNFVEVTPGTQYAVVDRYNIQPSINIYANVRGRDLGAVGKAVQSIIDKAQNDLPKGSKAVLRGQYETMHTSYTGLTLGILGAMVLVYLLIVVNFQSWLDPFVIITALPAALAGIAWMLMLTGTNLSVPALTGAIMTMGVATANSILVVAFARQKMAEGEPPLSAALEAGATRLRPVLMTALAMIIGMIPMAIGFGEGSEQNAPLGRAVIGGLLFATASTVFFVPVMFASMHRRIRSRTQ